MGRRSSSEEENHWPGFVDALSTIVMVVTFLLIILAIVIFVLSQSIAQSFVESMSEQTEKGGGDLQSDSSFTASGEFRSDAPPNDAPTEETPAPAAATTETAEVETSPDADAEPTREAQPEEETTRDVAGGPASETPSDNGDKAGEETSTGDALAALAEEPLSDSVEVSGEELAVRSRRVLDEEERIEVSAPDMAEEPAETPVTEAATFLTIAFDPAAAKISEDASGRVAEFLSGAEEALAGRQITIWAFIDTASGSVSQGRRTAYYRARAARNELLKNGYEGSDISVEIRPSPSPENNDTVRLVVSE
ncbi:MAG: hypothetical protein AAF871_06375 [Pseudomonadota bacterium]